MKLPSAILQSPLFDFNGKGQKVKQAAFFLLLLSTFFIPLSVELPVSPSTRLQFPLELLVPAAATLTLAGLFFYRGGFRFSYTDVAVIFFVAAAGMSAVFSVLPLTSIKSFSALAAYTTTFYFTARFLQLKKSQWQMLWQVLLLGYGCLLLYTLVRSFHLGIHRQHSYEMSLPFIPGHTLLVAIGFPAFLYSLHHLLQKSGSKLHLLFVLLFSFVTAISYSRFYWVLLSFSAFVFVFYSFKKIRIALIVSAMLLLTAGGIAYQLIDTRRDREHAWDDPDDHNSLFVQIQSIFVWEKNESNIERGNRWKVAREIFKAHPLTGAGLNTYPEIYFWYKDAAGVEDTNMSCVKMNAHQVYLGWLSEMGILGFVSGILLFASFLFAAIRLRGSPEFVFALLLALNFIALGIIEDFTTLEKIIAVFWIALACAHHLSLEKKSSS